MTRATASSLVTWMSCTLTQLAIYVRVLIALFTRTFFQPDEYFQALEPAHKAVFGYGHLTWEWTVSQPIRSIIYPALNVPVYYFLKTTGLSELGHVGDLLLVSDIQTKIYHARVSLTLDDSSLALRSCMEVWLHVPMYTRAELPARY